MAIKLLNDIEDLIKLHYVDDDIEEYFSYSRNEWIQWLVSNVENSSLMTWANLIDDNIVSYVVAYDCVEPPIADHVYIVYFYFDRDDAINKQYIKEVKEWASAVNAKTVEVAARDPRLFSKYGFNNSKEVMMELTV